MEANVYKDVHHAWKLEILKEDLIILAKAAKMVMPYLKMES
jgi:hypothetical protein